MGTVMNKSFELRRKS